ncbi:MAG: flagellar filament capping protein FliD [Planctomycetota bacterium]
MPGTTSISGLISGLDTQSIIKQLIDLERVPVTRLQTRIDILTNTKTIYSDVSARLLSFKLAAFNLSKVSAFDRRTVSSTNESALSAIAGTGTPLGEYAFKIGALAQASQHISKGFSAETSGVGTGIFTLELGAANLNRKTALSFLNGQQGVEPGKIKITNGSKSAEIDLSGAVNLEDVLDVINGKDLDITARVGDDGEGILLENSGAGAISVVEMGGTTAKDLGIWKSVGAGLDLDGDDVNNIAESTRLDELNQGLGVRILGGAVMDLRVNVDGADFDISLDGDETIADVIASIEAVAPVNVSVSADGNSLVIDDPTPEGGGNITVTALNGSKAAYDLGLEGKTAADTVTGDRVIPKLGDVLLRTIDGFSGIDVGTGLNRFDVTDRTGVTTSVTLDYGASASYTGLSDILAEINLDLAGVNVTARINDGGTGIILEDANAAGATTLSVADVVGTTAAGLGLAAPDSATTTELVGTNLQMAHISGNTNLSVLNGGRGIFAGKIKVTDKDGGTFIVDLSTKTTVGQVIEAINDKAAAESSNVTASVNATGDGIRLYDADLTGVALKVEEVGGGSTAKDLNLLGTASDALGQTIDGSFEFHFDVGAGDSLQTLRDAINARGIAVTASIVNDGTSGTPYRLSLLGSRTGALAQVVVDTGATSLDFSVSTEAQDAVLVMGATNPTQIRGNDNLFEDVATDLDIVARAVTSSPVTVTISRDTSRVGDLADTFVEQFNNVIGKIQELMSYDADAEEAGPLIGDRTLQSIEEALYDGVINPVKGISGRYDRLSRVGISVTKTGTLTFDQAAFENALAADPDGVRDLFTQVEITGNTSLSALGNGNGIRRVVGGDDFRVTMRDGSYLDVALGGAARTVQDVLAAINTVRAFRNGTADGDSTTLLLEDDSLIGLHADDFFKGMEVIVTGGANAGESRKITGYNAATGTLTLAAALPVALDATSAYEIANGGKVVASIGPDGRSILLTDASGGGSNLKVTALNSSKAAMDLGIENITGVASDILTGTKLSAITAQTGVGLRVDNRLQFVVNNASGTIVTTTDSLDETIALYQTQIDEFEARIKIREERLYRQFAALETSLAEMQSLSNFISTQLVSALSQGSSKK